MRQLMRLPCFSLFGKRRHTREEADEIEDDLPVV